MSSDLSRVSSANKSSNGFDIPWAVSAPQPQLRPLSEASIGGTFPVPRGTDDALQQSNTYSVPWAAQHHIQFEILLCDSLANRRFGGLRALIVL